MTRLMARAQLFDEFFKDAATGIYAQPEGRSTAPAQIRVDVTETDDAYSVLAEVPGVAREDIHVAIERNVVTLRADIKPLGEPGTGEKLLRRERRYGAVSRSFQLPVEIDSAAARAKYDNGVLRLSLPKRPEAQGQRLTVE